MKYRKGDICRVVRKGGPIIHFFRIGDIVEIVAVFEDGVYFAKDKYKHQSINESDLEPTTRSGFLYHISQRIKSFFSKK